MNTKLSQDEALLDPSLKLRPLKLSDSEPVAQLIHDACAADGDAILAESPEELLHEWQNPGFDVDADGFIVETEDGRIVGYGGVVNVNENAVFEILGNGHPDFKGLGIGTTLLRSVEKRARQLMEHAQPDVRVVLKTTISKNDAAGITLHENEGYRPVQYHWRMEINLNGEPAAPTSLRESNSARSFKANKMKRSCGQTMKPSVNIPITLIGRSKNGNATAMTTRNLIPHSG